MKKDDQKDVEKPWQKDTRIRQEKSEKELEGIIDEDSVLRKLKVRPGLFELPEGFPDASIEGFYTAQDSLQQRYPENDPIIERMNKYDNWKKVNEANQWKKGKEETYKNFPPPPEIPYELMPEFATVCRIRREAGLGMDKRISSQLGVKAFGAVQGLVLSKGGSKAGKAKTGSKLPLRVAIERLIELKVVYDLPSLLKVIAEAIQEKREEQDPEDAVGSIVEAMDDPDSIPPSVMLNLYHAVNNPKMTIDIDPYRLDIDKRVFSYTTRSGKGTKYVGFKRLNEIIKEVLKENPSLEQ